MESQTEEESGRRRRRKRTGTAPDAGPPDSDGELNSEEGWLSDPKKLVNFHTRARAVPWKCAAGQPVDKVEKGERRLDWYWGCGIHSIRLRRKLRGVACGFQRHQLARRPPVGQQ